MTLIIIRISFQVFSENLKELFLSVIIKLLRKIVLVFGFIESLLNESSINFRFKKKILIPKNHYVEKRILHKKDM